MKRASFFYLLGICLLVSTTTSYSQSSARSQNVGMVPANVMPPLIPLNGVVLDQHGRPLSGLITITLAIYPSQQGGTPLWTEVQTVEADDTGHYSVTLGATAPSGIPPLELFSSGEARWLGIQSQNHEELPRTLMLSVPYALKAADAETLGGKPASAFLTATTSTTGQPANSSDRAAATMSALAAPTAPGPTASRYTATADPGPGFISQATSGPPLQVSSSALNVNLNADLVDGFHATAFPKLAIPNTFTATQTIDTGNLDLDSSTATTGNITKNGERFLHNFGAGNTFLGLGAGNVTMTGDSNTAVGVAAGSSNTSGVDNTAIGVSALSANTSGFVNTAVGFGALGQNTTGSSNTAEGYLALSNNTVGIGNTASGRAALVNNLSGHNNTATGYNSLFNNISGSWNVANGINSLLSNTTGSNNVALGWNAGFNATTGSNNIYLGADISGVAGESNTMYLGKQGMQTTTFIAGVRGTTITGAEAVLIDAAGRLGSGAVTPSTNSVGSDQVIDGSLTASDLAPNSVTASQLAPDSVTGDKVGFNYAGSTSEGGPATDLACLGCVAASEVSFSFATLAANTFTGTQTIDGANLDLDPSTAATGNITKNGTLFMHNFGTQNTFLGAGAGNLSMTGFGRNTAVGFQALTRHTSGDSNTAIGSSALASNTEGNSNTAVGASSLQLNTTGGLNTASGHFALQFNTTGVGNTANGYHSLAFNTGGGLNTASGASALISNTSGSRNTAMGASALQNNNGSNNVAVGPAAGRDATTGSDNIYLGANVFGVAGESNTMYLGLQGMQTKTFIAGVRGITTVNPDAISVMIDSAGQLGTVSSSRRFKEDIRDMADASRRLLQLRPVTFRYKTAYGDGSKPIQYGLVAEEVAQAFPELAVNNANGDAETVHYETLNVLLLNELQKQEQVNERQQVRIDALEQRLDELLRQFATRKERR
jgi:hypothetical protein